MRKVDRILFIIGNTFFFIGVLGFIVGFIFEEMGKPYVAEVLYPICAVCGPITIIIFIVRLIIMVNMAKKYRVRASKIETPKQPKAEPVKEVKKTREQELYDQYEGLYKQGLITKEDLDKKKTELLGN